MNPLLESLGLLSKAMTIQKDLGSLFLSIFASQRQFLKPGLSLPMKNLSCWSSQLQRLSQWSFLAPSSAKPQVPLIVVGIITLVTNNMVCLDRRRSIALLARTRPTNEESVLEFPTPMMTVPVNHSGDQGHGLPGQDKESLITASWRGLDGSIALLEHTSTNQLCPVYVSVAQKGYNFRRTRHKISFKQPSDDLISFQNFVWEHLKDTGMDSTAYLRDPTDDTKMTSVIKAYTTRFMLVQWAKLLAKALPAIYGSQDPPASFNINSAQQKGDSHWTLDSRQGSRQPSHASHQADLQDTNALMQRMPSRSGNLHDTIATPRPHQLLLKT